MRPWRPCKAREPARSRAREASKEAGKEAAKEASTAGQEGGKAASPGSESSQPPAANVAAGKDAAAAAKPDAAAKSGTAAKSATGGTARAERGRIWVQDGNYVRPIDVRIGVTDGTNTEVSSLRSEEKLEDGMQVVIGEARNDQAADAMDNPLGPPKIFRGGQQKKSS